MRGAALVFLLGCGKGAGEALDWGSAADWAGAPGSWEWILDGEALPQAPPAVDFLGVDGLDTEAAYVAAAAAQGTTVWCYLSIGSAEDWRADYEQFLALDEAERAAGRAGVLGEAYAGWAGERWLNIGAWPVFLPLMTARVDVCADKGFGLVELDNMEVPSADEGDLRAYIEALVAHIDARGLGAIHKNATQLVDLEPQMSALLLEDCVLWDFCEDAAPYLAAGKPVWNVEYPAGWQAEGRDFDLDRACGGGVSTLIKRLSLDADTIVCD